jgi:hypothetical protein
MVAYGVTRHGNFEAPAPAGMLTITHISLWVRGQGRDVVY